MKTSPFTWIVTFVCLALVGLALLPRLPVKLNPSRSLPSFTVSFSMPGASARVVEASATGLLESMMARVEGVRDIHSTSGNGWGNIRVALDKHVDPAVAQFEASTLIRQAWPELPAGTGYPYIVMNVPEQASQGPFLAYTINAPASPILIQRYAEENIKPKLARLSGIYRINLGGATPMEWRLTYDSKRLEALGIGPDDIREAIRSRYDREFLGTYDVSRGDREEWMRLALVPTGGADTFDPAQIPVVAKDGRIVHLDQLVEATHVEAEPRSYYRINGLNSIYLSLVAGEDANQLELAKQVKALMDDIRPSLPAGYEIHTGYDASEYIRGELAKIYYRTALTVAILLLFVWLITRDTKYLLLIVVSLSVGIAIAFILYYFLGLEMQLYSLAGVTISLNLVIDNTIVMSDHYLRRRDRKAFLPVLAATLTTMGALVIVFFLDESIRLNLQDFAAVVIVNLGVSLPVALFFVPALADKLGMRGRKPSRAPRSAWRQRWLGWRRRLPVRFGRVYARLIRALCLWRVAVCLLLALAFGGSLWLFIDKVYEGSYFTRNDEVTLYANATLPNGSTLEQMNTLMKRMESYLCGFQEISQFQTSIDNARRASISIHFKKEYRRGPFPYRLKSDMIGKALQLGGGSWTIYGLEDQGFSNDVHETAGNYRLTMHGYNYDELYAWAERLRERLLSHRRIKEVTIDSEFSYWKDDYEEFRFDLDKRRMAEEGVDARTLFATIRPVYGQGDRIGEVPTATGMEEIWLSSRQSREGDAWGLRNTPFRVAGRTYKLSEMASVEKALSPQNVVKENQQYRLCLQYEYIGSWEQGRKTLERDLEEFGKLLPMGYTVKSEEYFGTWNKETNKQYWWLAVVVAIIFFITSVLFNSLKQPLAIIFTIPVAYMGVFLTFYAFNLNFDQGGFASFVLLCGITVNAGIYLLGEYNAVRRQRPRLTPLRAYVKAWNRKIVPIFLTVASTILGFLPFMIGEREGFWFPLAAGTVGGLSMSMLAIFILLPVLTLKKTSSMRHPNHRR
ncbi:MAG: efflux RND transporter permease subunit [Mediterranea sp.]|jgi:multidrug efflux pump subunit AcrB|nr:efflux RND transporter permease subunit [Mediterranea sp.]